MKTLEELGISPAPWVVARWYENTTGKPYSNINTASGFYVVGNDPAAKIAAVVKKAEAALAKASGESEVAK